MDFSRPFFAFSLSESIILLNLVFSLFLQYLQGNVSQNFDVNHFLAKIAKKKKKMAHKFLRSPNLLRERTANLSPIGGLHLPMFVL